MRFPSSEQNAPARPAIGQPGPTRTGLVYGTSNAAASPGARNRPRPASIQELAQGGPQPGQGATAVAQGVLHAGTEFAEGPVVLRDQEQRVVAEAARPARRPQDDAVAAALGGGPHVALGVGQD